MQVSRHLEFKLFVALCALLLLAACERAPTLPKLNPHDVIVAFGDSLTHGTGAKTEESYPAVLAKLIGRSVVNSGIPGEVSAEGLKRLPEVLDAVKPRLLILCHGGNDMLRKLDKSQLRQNLIAMVETAQSRDIDVVLLGVPEPTLLMRSTAPVYLEVAEHLNLPIEADKITDIEGDNDLKADHVHPNGEGYRQLAHAVADLLRRSGAIR